MIVEAGYDLCTLLFDGAAEPGSLRMVTLDADLRLCKVEVVVRDFAGEFDHATIDAIDLAIPDDEDYPVRFVALGFQVPDVAPYPERFDWDRQRVLHELLSCRGIDVLGVQVSDGEWWASSGPVHAFESYAISDEIPRVLVIRGPHPFDSCECAVCGPRRQAWQRPR